MRIFLDRNSSSRWNINILSLWRIDRTFVSFTVSITSCRIANVKIFIVLETLATHEDHRGLRLGSKLLDWGNEEADRRGWECYLDATLKAVSLYERHGYVAQPFQAKGTPSIPMVRPAKKQES
jgi:GNAT superfamily N-acetyltransferase